MCHHCHDVGKRKAFRTYIVAHEYQFADNEYQHCSHVYQKEMEEQMAPHGIEYGYGFILHLVNTLILRSAGVVTSLMLCSAYR